MHSIDLFVQNYFSTARTPFLTEWLYIFTSFFDISANTVVLVLSITTLIYLVRDLRYAFLFIATLSFATLNVYFLKISFAVGRPEDAVMATFGHSFPSYHATIATIFFIMLMYIFDGYLSFFTRILFNTFCVSGFLVVAFSRVYLGVHWFSDVFFGIILGSLISYVAIGIFKYVINVHGKPSMIK